MYFYKRLGVAGLLLVSLIGSGVWAQQTVAPPLTWDAAPNPIPIRHSGDWMYHVGWYDQSTIYGPFETTDFEVGDESEFTLAFSVDNSEPYPFVLRHKSRFAYFWFPKDFDIAPERLQEAARYFEENIIPQTHSIFGDTMPDIDNDPRLHIVHEPFLWGGAVGVFRPADQCPQFLCSESNQRDILYYSLDWGAVNTEKYLTTLAHEYQHVIRFEKDGNERRWLNEGFSQLSEHLNGFPPEYTVGANLEAYLQNPNHPLNGWANALDNLGSHYGSSYLFVLYLYERFGLDFIRELSNSPYDGLAAVHRVLAANPQHEIDLNTVFADWLVANYLDDPFVAQGQYYYPSLNLPIQVATQPLNFESNSLQTITNDLNQYGGEYLSLPPNTYRIQFSGVPQTPINGGAPYSGDWMWWSYETESSITSLTRQLDLREVSSATLEYALWYRLEEDYDYGTVMISTDGEHWEPLQTPTMKSETEHIYTPHYTGFSPNWITEQIDLSDYAGERVWIRFDTVTDGSIGMGGMLLDDLRVPEINWFDDVETLSDDWTTTGFLRVPEYVSQDWALTIIRNSTPATVEKLTLQDDNKLFTELDLRESGGVLVIGAMAPLTEQTAEYKLVVEAVN